MNSDDQEQYFWSRFYQISFPIAKLSSIWRARHTYSFIRDLKINSLLELGAGTGLCARFLGSKTKARTTLLEKDPRLAIKLKEKNPDKEIIQADLFKFNSKRKWDLVYSLGVIEHFSYEQRVKAIKIHQKLSSQYILIAVPVESVIRNYLVYPLEKIFSISCKLYQPGELEKEFQKAGLKPWRIKENALGATILSKKNK